MSKALSGPVLDERPVAVTYDPVEEAPDLDLLVTTRRQGKGSRWSLQALVEGESKPLTKTQSDFGGAVLRHAAYILLDRQKLMGKSKVEIMVAEARLARRMVHLALGDWVTVIHALTEAQGVDNVAAMLDLSRAEVEEILLQRPFKPRLGTAEVGPPPGLVNQTLLSRRPIPERVLSRRVPSAWTLPKPKRKKRLVVKGR